MRGKFTTFLRVVLFVVVLCLFLSILGTVFQPVWTDWNNYNTIQGFYDQPKNTIESIFLGASTMVNAVSPMEIYKEYGICSYNLATEQQPFLASYYWLKEAYKLHKKTLKTVFIDATELRDVSSDYAFHKAIDAMRFSPVKINAVYDKNNGKIIETLTDLFSLTSYHDRWSSMSIDDWNKFFYDKNNGSRGYNFETTVNSYKNAILNSYKLNEAAQPAELVDESVKELEKIMSFCDANDLKLVILKTVASNWSSELHNAVQALADKHTVRFIDFNYDPSYSEIAYTAFDSCDLVHHNYFGAKKFSLWLGKYLDEKCDATDVRDDERYEFMQDEYDEYKLRVEQSIELQTASTVEGYFEIALQNNNTLFITVCDEAASALDVGTRQFFADTGLEKLSQISVGDSYIGVVENGKVIYEDIKSCKETDKKPIVYSGTLSDGTDYELKSGASGHGTVSSCVIGDSKEEYSIGRRGINISIYSNDVDSFLRSDNFDTYQSLSRDVYTYDLVDILTNGSDITWYNEGSYAYHIFQYRDQLAMLNQ